MILEVIGISTPQVLTRRIKKLVFPQGAPNGKHAFATVFYFFGFECSEKFSCLTAS